MPQSPDYKFEAQQKSHHHFEVASKELSHRHKTEENQTHEKEAIDVVFYVEGLTDAIAFLRFHLSHDEYHQVTKRVVQNEVGTESLGQFVHNRQPMQPLQYEQLSSFLYLRSEQSTLWRWITSKSTAVRIIVPSSRNECR